MHRAFIISHPIPAQSRPLSLNPFPRSGERDLVQWKIMILFFIVSLKKKNTVSKLCQISHPIPVPGIGPGSGADSFPRAVASASFSDFKMNCCQYIFKVSQHLVICKPQYFYSKFIHFKITTIIMFC